MVTKALAPSALDRSRVSSWVAEMLNRWPAVGMAVGVIRGGRLDYFLGHGVANVESQRPIDEDTVFRVASITKTFTAIAVMQLVEQGLVALDRPANDYLRAFQLVPAKPGFRPATVRHLLTHTSGIPEMVHPSRALGYIFGETFGIDEPLPSLGEYYRGGLRLVFEPGTRFMYTDHNFATLGQIVADISGLTIDRYLRERVFEPLGMFDTDLLRSERVKASLATGYVIHRNGPKAVTDRQFMTSAASSAYSTPRDMARYVAAILGGGRNEHGSVLKPATLAMMFEAHYQPHRFVPGIGLAFDRFNVGGHFAVGHEGIVPGFTSQILAAPDEGIGLMAFTNGARRAMIWLPGESARLLGHVLGAAEPVIRNDVAQHPERWGEICGWYQLAAGAADTRSRAMVGLGAQVYVRHGELRLRVVSPFPELYRGFALHPDDESDPLVFRIDVAEQGIGTVRIVFGPNPLTGTMQVHFEAFPMSLDKRPPPKKRRWLARATGAVAVAAIGAMVLRGARDRR